MKLKSLLDDETADAKMIGGVVGILVTLIIAVLVFYNISANIDYSTADENIMENVYGMSDDATSTPVANDTRVFAENATSATLDQAATFFTIAPIIAIVVVAVVILKYVGQI